MPPASDSIGSAIFIADDAEHLPFVTRDPTRRMVRRPERAPAERPTIGETIS
jgi:hypothetical protein